MSQHRRLVGGSDDGYSIMLAEEVDAEGLPIAIWFEVYGPDGDWLGSFPSMEAASECIDLQKDQAPHPSTRNSP